VASAGRSSRQTAAGLPPKGCLEKASIWSSGTGMFNRIALIETESITILYP